MVDVPRKHGVETAEQQAALFHARERRRSFSGVPELARTHRFAIPTATLPAASFPSRVVPFTFATSIEVVENGGVHQGLIFELGDANVAIAAWVDDDQIGFRAGSLGDDRALASFTTGTGELQVGRRFDLVFSVRPGDGRVRFWDDSLELGRATAVNGAFPAGWAAASDGAFAAAATGALPADVVRTGAPTGFVVVRPLSVYAGQYPRHFT